MPYGVNISDAVTPLVMRTKSAWPMTLVARALFCCGICDQYMTRLLPLSATSRRKPSVHKPAGEFSVVSLATVVLVLLVTKSGWPTTTLAGTPLEVGTVFQIRMRSLFWSDT